MMKQRYFEIQCSLFDSPIIKNARETQFPGIARNWGWETSPTKPWPATSQSPKKTIRAPTFSYRRSVRHDSGRWQQFSMRPYPCARPSF